MIFVDANVFMFAAGRASPQQQPCRDYLHRVVQGEAEASCTSSEVLQEILHRYRAIRRPKLGFQLFDAVVSLGIPILSVTEADVRRARQLLENWPGLSTRDGVHLGVMQSHSLQHVMSYDQQLDRVDWVTRLEP